MRSLFFLASLFLLQGGGVGAQNPDKASAALFKNERVLHIDINLEPKELDALRRKPREYARATLKEGDTVYSDVGIHVKGAAGSFRGIDDRPGLTINMNKFDESKLFHGLDKWHLANSVQDGTYLHELICGELFRAAGVPASRIAFATVTINNRKRGLYYLKEGYDKYFLMRHFKNSDGNLYDGGFLRDIDQPLQLLRTKKDVKDHADLKALTAACREKDLALRFQKLEKLLDLDRFLSYIVLQVVTWDWDGYPMNRNNYRIYHDPVRDKLIFFPSGMDQMWGNPGGPITPGFQGLAARALMETPEGKKRYQERVKEIHAKVFAPHTLMDRIHELQPRIQTALASVDANAARDYPNRVKHLTNLIQERWKHIERQLQK